MMFGVNVGEYSIHGAHRIESLYVGFLEWG